MSASKIIEAVIQEASLGRWLHGTSSKTPFTEFRRAKLTPGLQFGFGFHFTKDRKLAELYGRIIEVELTANKVLNAQQIVKEGDPLFPLALKFGGRRSMVPMEGKLAVWLQNALDMSSPQRAEKLLREFGYDAVIYKASHGGMINPATRIRNIEREAESIVVLDPGQIRIVQ